MFKSKFIINNAGAVLGALIVLTLAASAQSVWNEPVATPPGGNTDAPVNVGSLNQLKNGVLGVNGLGVFGNAYISGNVGVGLASPAQKLDVNGYVRGATGLCIGDDCRTSWPATGASKSPSLSTRYWVGGSGEHYYCQDGDVACGVDVSGTSKGVWCCKFQ